MFESSSRACGSEAVEVPGRWGRPACWAYWRARVSKLSEVTQIRDRSGLMLKKIRRMRSPCEGLDGKLSMWIKSLRDRVCHRSCPASRSDGSWRSRPATGRRIAGRRSHKGDGVAGVLSHDRPGPRQGLAGSTWSTPLRRSSARAVADVLVEGGVLLLAEQERPVVGLECQGHRRGSRGCPPSRATGIRRPSPADRRGGRPWSPLPSRFSPCLAYFSERSGSLHEWTTRGRFPQRAGALAQVKAYIQTTGFAVGPIEPDLPKQLSQSGNSLCLIGEWSRGQGGKIALRVGFLEWWSLLKADVGCLVLRIQTGCMGPSGFLRDGRNGLTGNPGAESEVGDAGFRGGGDSIGRETGGEALRGSRAGPCPGQPSAE